MSRQDIDRQFRRKRLWQVIFLLLVGVVMALGLMPLHPRGESVLRRTPLSFVTKEVGLAIAGGAAFLYLLFTFINWRCPACRKMLWFGLFASKCKGCQASFTKGGAIAGQAADQTDSHASDQAAEHSDGKAASANSEQAEAVEPPHVTAAPESNSNEIQSDSESTQAHPSEKQHASELPPIEQPVAFDRRRGAETRRTSIDRAEHSADNEALLHDHRKLVRCVACPRCGSASYRKKRPDKVLPIFRVRECRNCNQQYNGPSSKKVCLLLLLVGIGAVVPWLMSLSKYSDPMKWLLGEWLLAIPGLIGFVIVLVALKKMFLQRLVDPPERIHGRRRGDINQAYETESLLLSVPVKPAAVDKPLEDPRQKAKAVAAESTGKQIAAATVGTTKKKERAKVSVTETSKADAPANAVAVDEKPVASTPALSDDHVANSSSRQLLRAGCVIPAHPLALTPARQLDERRMRALTRYYLDAGAGGVAIGVHTTQFAIREQPLNMFRHVLEQTMGELFDYEMNTQKPLVKVVGICGETKQAINEAELGAGLGYDAGLLNLGAMRLASNEQLLWHCREVAKAIPVFGFYLAPSVGGRVLDYAFWRKFAEIENVVAIKIAAFNRYETTNVVRAVAEAGRAIQSGPGSEDNPEGIALYTGNDDHIVGDLLGEWTFNVNGENVTQRIVGGLLGHWAVWTKAAVDTFESIRKVNQGDQLPLLSTTLDRQVTDMNAAIFDAANKFAGCVPGIHEVLRRQGLLDGNYCLNHSEKLSPGQADEITRVINAYPHLTDDEFVAANKDKWLR